MEPVEISAGAVHLRPPRLEDVDAITAVCQDPEIQRWTRVPSPYRRKHALFFVEQVAQPGWQAGTSASFLVLDSTTAALVGSVALMRIADGSADVGFWTARDARGRGVGTAAVGAVCRWGFGALGLRRISWHAAIGNVGSRRLAERLGFRFEGTMRAGLEHRGQWVDGWLAGLLPEDRPPQRIAPTGDGVVRLRPWRLDDAPTLPALVDDEVLRWTPLPKPFDAEQFLERTSTAMQFAVEVDGELVGGAVLIDGPAAEGESPLAVALGYWLAPDARGQGHAQRVARLLIGLAQGRGASRVELEILPGNEPSRRLAERLGFRYEGTLRRARLQRGERCDVEIHALVSGDPGWLTS